MRARTGIILLMAVCAGRAAVGAPTADEAMDESPRRGVFSVSVAGLQVRRAPRGGARGMRPFGVRRAMRPFDSAEGICVVLLVEAEAKRFLAVDPYRSEVQFLRDSKGNDLQPVSVPDEEWWVGLDDDVELPGRPSECFGVVGASEDHTAVLIGIRGAALPAKGSSGVHVKGSFRAIVADRLVTAREQHVAIEKGSEISQGPVLFTITDVKEVSVEEASRELEELDPRELARDYARKGELSPQPGPGLLVTVRATGSVRDLNCLAKDEMGGEALRFFDEDGREVKSSSDELSGRYSVGGDEGTEVHVIRLYRPIRRGDVVVSWWDGYGAHAEEFDVEADLSLQ